VGHAAMPAASRRLILSEAKDPIVEGAPEFSPLPPDAPKEDRIGTALLSMGSATAAGMVWFSVLMLIVTHLRADSTAQTLEQIDPHALYVNIAAYGTMIGVGFIGACAWTLLAPIPSRYRRGALSVVTALGGWCVAMAATYLAHAMAGGGALAGLAIASVILALFLARQAALSSRE
jgi:hypothetical protein